MRNVSVSPNTWNIPVLYDTDTRKCVSLPNTRILYPLWLYKSAFGALVAKIKATKLISYSALIKAYVTLFFSEKSVLLLAIQGRERD